MHTHVPSPPRSPFTTRFSGTMRENKERIRNIFNGGHKRPGRWLLPLAVLVILFCCFALVSCQRQESTPSLVMDTQYYDENGNYIEIPALTLPEGEEPTEGVTEINEALSELRAFYQPVLAGTAEDAGLASRENQCLLYPTETERYLNLLFFRNVYHTDLNTGHITSLVYDKQEGIQVTLDQALEMVGQTEEELIQALAEQYDPILAEEIPGIRVCIQNQALEGFRMGQDGQPVFYLTARVDDAADEAEDAISGAEHIYIWSDGSFTQYDQYAVSDLQPLVPAEECLDLEPPLWRQWFFDGGAPEGGFAPLLSAQNRSQLETLYGAVAHQMIFNETQLAPSMAQASPTLLQAYQQGDYTVAAATFQDAYDTYLVIGVIDDATGSLADTPYISVRQGGTAHAVLSQQDGETCMLYTFNQVNQEVVSGECGAIGLEGGHLLWSWPVQGTLLDGDSQLRSDYDAWCGEYLALMAPGGVDLFQRSQSDAVDGEEPQWIPYTRESFYRAPEQDLPLDVYDAIRVWLEEFTRKEYNPWAIPDASAVWQISSITPEEGKWSGEGETVYSVVARADCEKDLCLKASIRFNHTTGTVSEVLTSAAGSEEELGIGFSYSTYPLTLSDGRTLTLEFEEVPLEEPGNVALVRQVRVWDGSRLLQTIMEGDVRADGVRLYEGIYRHTDKDEVPGAPDLRDINGDGSADLGLLVNKTFSHNVNYAYFLWDDQAEQLRYSGMFFASPELESSGQIIETERGVGGLSIRRRYIFLSDHSDMNYGVPLFAGFDSRGSLPPEETTLPIPEEGVTFSFSSGAGAWSTYLTLLPDGTFSGTYSDSDMGSNTVYLCQFQGNFSMFTPMSDHIYDLTLTNLEITTGHPVDEEWIEDGTRYVAAIPYGLNGGNEFSLYLPGTAAEFIPEECRLWNGEAYGLYPGATLSGYSLYNVRGGYGFFTYDNAAPIGKD